MTIRLKKNQKKILAKYDKLLQQFLDDNLSERNKIIEVETNPNRDIINQLYKLYNFVHYIYAEYLLKRKYTVQKAVMYDFVLKAGQTTYSIYLCLDKYLERDAAILCRSLFELYLNVYLILEKDIENRIDLYKNFFPVLKFQEYEKGLLIIEDEEEKKKLIENYNKYKDNYRPKNPTCWYWILFNDKITRGKEPNLYDISKHLDSLTQSEYFSKMYKNVYRIFSMVSHSNVGSSNIIGISRNICFLTINFCSEICQNTLANYKIKGYKELIEYFNLFYYICF